jgi:hypothetical protein
MMRRARCEARRSTFRGKGRNWPADQAFVCRHESRLRSSGCMMVSSLQIAPYGANSITLEKTRKYGLDLAGRDDWLRTTIPSSASLAPDPMSRFNEGDPFEDILQPEPTSSSTASPSLPRPSTGDGILLTELPSLARAYSINGSS